MNSFIKTSSLRLVLIPLFFTLLLTGCGKKDLYSDLTEQDANEMIAILQNAGIPADKQGSISSFSVVVDLDHFAIAVDTLRAVGIPRKALKSMGEVFEKEGFVSSPLEERARLNFAQTQELTGTIESIDGVVLARVHLAVPEHDPLSDQVRPSSASVFIKYNPEIDVTKREPQVKSLVVNSIEGMQYEKVTVVMVPTETTPSSIIVPMAANSGLVGKLIGGIAILIVMLLFMVWRQFRPSFSINDSQSKTVVPLFSESERDVK